MKLPYLRIWDNTPVIVTLTQGTDRNGSPKAVQTVSTDCCFSEKQKIIRTADGQIIQMNASLTIGRDIAPEIEALAGCVRVNGGSKKWSICNSKRPRNPDGTVNHTFLGLI